MMGSKKKKLPPKGKMTLGLKAFLDKKKKKKRKVKMTTSNSRDFNLDVAEAYRRGL